VEIGNIFNILYDPRAAITSTAAFDRQVRAFGTEGQRAIRLTRVAIVGLGGTGSLVAQQLAYLGVDDFILVDPDLIEPSNLNRTAGSAPDDVGTAKVEVASRTIRSVQPNAKIVRLNANVLGDGIARQVAEADVIFCCTDTHASRHLLNQLSYQFLVPVIDMGVAIDVRHQDEPRIAGHVKALAPELPCLWCVGNLDPRQVREEMMTSEHRNSDPYFLGRTDVVQPAVISINGTVASLAVTMFLALVAGIKSDARFLVYDGNRGRVNAISAEPNPNCNFCSPTSTAYGGDAYPLPQKRHA
jgi:molybdopterin/thiamine biosynthesis adenylyltransferase